MGSLAVAGKGVVTQRLSCIGDTALTESQLEQSQITELEAIAMWSVENDIIAVEKTDVAVIQRDAFKHCIEGQLTSVAPKNEAIQDLYKVVLLKSLPKQTIDTLSRIAQLRHFADG